MFSEFNKLLTEVVNESISCTPDTWRKGTLTIESDGMAIFYKLKNEGAEEKASISNSLRTLCEQLYLLMKEHGHTWKIAYVFFYQDLEGGWKFKTEFEYEDGSIKTINKEPWWKFWAKK